MNEIIENNYIPIPKIDLSKSINIHFSFSFDNNVYTYSKSKIDLMDGTWDNFYSYINDDNNNLNNKFLVSILNKNNEERYIILISYICKFNKDSYLKKFTKTEFDNCPIHSYDTLKQYAYKFAIIDPMDFLNSLFNPLNDIDDLTGYGDMLTMPILEFGFSDKIYYQTSPDRCFWFRVSSDNSKPKIHTKFVILNKDEHHNYRTDTEISGNIECMTILRYLAISYDAKMFV